MSKATVGFPGALGMLERCDFLCERFALWSWFLDENSRLSFSCCSPSRGCVGQRVREWYEEREARGRPSAPRAGD